MILKPSTPAQRAVGTPKAPTAGTPASSQFNTGILLGHFSYAETPADSLRAVTADGQVKLRSAAAIAFEKMMTAAEQDGAFLQPLSGFRSLKDQDDLFFRIQAERGQGPTERATVSAPPGYSEHHTGYAIDIGDATAPSTHVNPAFEETAAFRWLQAHAASYHFELSFPKNNPQGVSYEPWHWRFVGDRHSLEMFYKARALKPVSSK
jgi:D-alanyl-D-alanine carboxypeptidase